MSKKSRSKKSSETPKDTKTVDSEEIPPSVTKSPGEDAGKRMQGTLLLVGLVGVLASVDKRRLREAVTVAFLDHWPLITPAIGFAVFAVRKWVEAGKRGMHPAIRVLGFSFLLFLLLGALPFNSRVEMYETPLLLRSECASLVAAADAMMEQPGFVPSNGKHDLSDEVLLDDLSLEMFTMVNTAFRERLLPYLALRYAGQAVVNNLAVVRLNPLSLSDADDADHIVPGHLALTVELSPPEEFIGGGIWLRVLGKSLSIAHGSVLIFPSRLWHGGDAVTSGSRYVLVGSVTLTGGSEGQSGAIVGGEWPEGAGSGGGLGFLDRIRGVFDLRGLFARSVWFVAEPNSFFQQGSSAPGGEVKDESRGKGGIGR